MEWIKVDKNDNKRKCLRCEFVDKTWLEIRELMKKPKPLPTPPKEDGTTKQ